MKNFYLLLLAVLFTAPLLSQSVIEQSTAINDDGNVAHPSAILDINAADKGLLIPRINLVSIFDPSPINNNAPAIGLLVYNINPSIGEGYYYWSNSEKWESLAGSNGGNQTLSIIGDSLGISDGNKVSVLQSQIADGDRDTKVVANEDYVSVEVDGTERVRFEDSRIEFLNSGRSVFIGEEAGLLDDLTDNINVFIGYQSGRANSTGFQNTAIGSSAFVFNTTGHSNTAIGSFSMYKNTTGFENTAFGRTTLTDNTTGFANAAFGLGALTENERGNFNTAIGRGALTFNTIGNNNTALGRSALQNNVSGSNNIALGYFAGFNAQSSDKLYIENSNADSNAALIYGVMDNGAEMLRVNGGFEVSEVGDTSKYFEVATNGEVTINGAYTLPNIDGATNQVLTTDGSGNVTWQTASGGGGSQTLSSLGDSLEISGGNKVSIAQMQIVDGDQDTKVVANEDYVSVHVDTIERVRFEEGRMEFLDNGQSVFIGEDAGANDDLSLNGSTFVGYRAGQANTSGNSNSALGGRALSANTTGFANTAIGRSSLQSNTIGIRNVGLGSSTLLSNTIGSNNVASGTTALFSNTTGSNNTANGDNSLRRNTTGNFNTAIGQNTLNDNETGSGNIALGYKAGFDAVSSNKLYIENSEVDSNAALVYGVMDNGSEMLRINGGFEVSEVGDTSRYFEVATNGEVTINGAYTLPNIDGTTSQVLTTDGSGVVTWETVTGSGGPVAIDDLTDGKAHNRSVYLGVDAGMADDGVPPPPPAIARWNTGVGHSALKNSTSTNNTAVGSFALPNNTTGTRNTGVGRDAMFESTIGNDNVSIGYRSLFSNFYGNDNITIGNDAAYHNDIGSQNIAIGSKANEFNSGGTHNTIIGFEAGKGTSVHSKSRNIFLGFQAGYNEIGSDKLYIESSSSSSPLIYGDFADDTLRVNGTLDIKNAYHFPMVDGTANQVLTTDGSGNVTWQAGGGGGSSNLIEDDINGDTEVKAYDVGNLDSEDHIRLDIEGTNVLYLDRKTLHFNNLGRSVFIGAEAGANDDLSDNENVIIGDSAGVFNTTGHSNVFIGRKAGHSNTTGERNTFLGWSAGYSSTGNFNTFLGNGAGFLNSTGFLNTFVGDNAGRESTTGFNNTFIGQEAGFKNDTASWNTFVGRASGFHNKGRFNTFMGALAGNSNISGINNTFIGMDAGRLNQSGSYNTVMGSAAGHNLTNSDNTIIGAFAGNANVTGQRNTFIGAGAGYSNLGTHNVFLGNQAGHDVVGGSNLLYIENTTSIVPLIYGDFASDRVGINRIATTNAFEVEGNASKASSGPWMSNSDARLKKNIQPLASEETLQQLLQLQGVTYEWNDDRTGYKRPEGVQYGFTAQDIQQTFPELVSEDAQGYLQTAYSTYDAMYVEALRALNDKIENLEKENSKLKSELAGMEELKAEVEGIKQLLSGTTKK